MGFLRGTFAVEHFLPVAIHPTLSADYDNLVYSCVRCNGAKGMQHVPDPCQVLLRDDLRVLEDGSIEARTPAAQRAVRMLGLNDPEPREFRALWLRIVALAQEHDPALYLALMGFPGDLPQLSRLRPPGGNTRPQGVQESWHARWHEGTLPAIC